MQISRYTLNVYISLQNIILVFNEGHTKFKAFVLQLHFAFLCFVLRSDSWNMYKTIDRQLKEIVLDNVTITFICVLFCSQLIRIIVVIDFIEFTLLKSVSYPSKSLFLKITNSSDAMHKSPPQIHLVLLCTGEMNTTLRGNISWPLVKGIGKVPILYLCACNEINTDARGL